MSRSIIKRGSAGLVLAFIIIAFIIGMVNLFYMRFETGDILPAYSSLRSDPLGSKALFESLDKIEGLSVKRNHKSLNQIEASRGTTVLYLGANLSRFYFSLFGSMDPLDSLAVTGGRLVMAFAPVMDRPYENDDEIKDKKKAEKKKAKKDKDLPAEKEIEKKKKSPQDEKKAKKEVKKSESLPLHWGLSFGFERSFFKKNKSIAAVRKLKNSDLPQRIAWHSILYFKDLNKQWKTVYAVKGRPVVIERKFGQGTIVLASDSYYFSNEALKNDPRPRLLTWFIGPEYKKQPKILFEETHFGLGEQDNVAGLARKYRLHGLFAGLLVLAGLFIWRNSTSLVPPEDDDVETKTGVFSSQRDYTAGLVSLLRRNIPTDQVLSVCVKEWESTYANRLKDWGDAPQKIKDMVASGAAGKDPVRDYKTIHTILSEGKKSWKITRNS